MVSDHAGVSTDKITSIPAGVDFRRFNFQINGEKITIGDTPIFTKGCIVKYALFLGNSKLMLNLENDPEDDSEISKHFSKENKFIKDTLKLRDTNGKWTKQFDSVIQSELEIFDRKLRIAAEYGTEGFGFA